MKDKKIDVKMSLDSWVYFHNMTNTIVMIAIDYMFVVLVCKSFYYIQPHYFYFENEMICFLKVWEMWLLFYVAADLLGRMVFGRDYYVCKIFRS